MALITSDAAKGVAGRCPLCGQPAHACGGRPGVHPVDEPMHLPAKETAMNEPVELKDYTWTQNGSEMTGRLSPADAERLGARPVDGSAATADDEKRTTKKRSAPDNK